MGNIICKCGSIILNDNIDFWNGCNEEGEEYGVITAKCDKCGKDYETSEWGEWENEEAAKEYLQDYINKL